MTKSEFIALWELNRLHNVAVYKYRSHDYDSRERVIPSNKHNELELSERHRHSAINYGNWYGKWENAVIGCLSKFRESADLIFKFTNLKLGKWTDTTANRFEKQIVALEKIQKSLYKTNKILLLWRFHYDADHKKLLVLREGKIRNKVDEVSFAGMPLAHDVLSIICEDPKRDHDMHEVLEKIDFAEAERYEAGDRKAYDTIQNANKKVAKDIGLEDFFVFKGDVAWVNERYI